MVSGIRINDMHWLATSISKEDSTLEQQQQPQTNRSGISKFLLRYKLFIKFMHWIFSDFINPLVSCSFYVTEVEGRANEVLFFRKPIWSFIVRHGIVQMKNHFMPVRIQASIHLLVMQLHYNVLR